MTKKKGMRSRRTKAPSVAQLIREAESRCVNSLNEAIGRLTDYVAYQSKITRDETKKLVELPIMNCVREMVYEQLLQFRLDMLKEMNKQTPHKRAKPTSGYATFEVGR